MMKSVRLLIICVLFINSSIFFLMFCIVHVHVHVLYQTVKKRMILLLNVLVYTGMYVHNVCSVRDGIIGQIITL